jgi:hypothetical protein
MVYLFLSVPLRTTLELDVRFSAQRPPELVEVLKKCRDLLSKSLGSQYVVESIELPDDCQPKIYTSLAEDLVPSTLQPLLSVKCIDLISVEMSSMSSCGFKNLKSATLIVYDRSLGALELNLQFDGIDDYDLFLEGIDAWVSEFVCKAINVLLPIYSEIFSVLTKTTLRDGVSVMRLVSETSSFFDKCKNNSAPSFLEKMWISRVLFVNGSDIELRSLERWAQGQIALRSLVPLGVQNAAICVGNSVVFGELDSSVENAVHVGLRLSNIIYSMVHVLSHNQRVVHGNFVGQKTSSIVAAQLTTSIRGTLDLIEHDYEDCLLGMQGMRRAVVTNYLDAWSFEKLFHSSYRRVDSVAALVQDAIMRTNLRYVKIVESALVVIGGVTLLDFSLNLMTYSRTIALLKDDGWFGLIDIANSAPEDLMLYGLLFVVVLVAIVKFRE